MGKIYIPASITLENGFSISIYKWKSCDKTSRYKKSTRRAVIRFSNKTLAIKISRLAIKNRQISVDFIDDSNVAIKRSATDKISLQGYSGKHPCLQIIVNRSLPVHLWENLNTTKKKTLTFPITVEFNLDEWRDVGLRPSDFILEIEKESKFLMNRALEKGFTILKISKGREYDLGLITPNNKPLIIALSSHIAKTKSRSKEKTIQKILMDISKMLPYLDEHKNTIPLVITRPIEFENSWSFTTKKYLDFYRDKFGFIFLTTEFKNGWEDDIIKEMLKL